MLKLEKIETDHHWSNSKEQMFHVYRAPVYGGWLVLMRQQHADSVGPAGEQPFAWAYGGTTFVPDPGHEWDGSSVDLSRKV